MSEKVIGYTLLTIGIITIVFSALDVYLVFTKQKQPIQLFNFEGVSFDPSLYTPQVEVPKGMEQFMQQKPKTSQKVEILPGDVLNLSSNLFAHIMLMGFIVSIGGKIATLGTQLIRPVVVKLHESHQQSTQK